MSAVWCLYISTIKSSIWQPGVGLVGKVTLPFIFTCHTGGRVYPEAPNSDVILVWILIGWDLLCIKTIIKLDHPQLTWKGDYHFLFLFFITWSLFWWDLRKLCQTEQKNILSVRLSVCICVKLLYKQDLWGQWKGLRRVSSIHVD